MITLKNEEDFYLHFKNLEKEKVELLINAMAEVKFVKPTIISLYYKYNKLTYSFKTVENNVVGIINMTKEEKIVDDDGREEIKYVLEDSYTNLAIFNSYWTNEKINKIYKSYYER